MFFAAVLQTCDDARFESALHTYMKAAASVQSSNIGLFSGTAGLIATCEYATTVEPRYDGLLHRALDELCRAHHDRSDFFQPATKYHEYDIISGRAGQALALHFSQSQPSLKASCDYLCWLLEDSNRWCCPHPVQTWQGPVNDLGIAHGLAGILSALAIASPTEEYFDASIESGLRMLSKHQYANGNLGWPASVASSQSFPSRNAWCYGIPGSAAALFLGSRRIKEPIYEAIALSALEALADSPMEEWRVTEFSICHGFIGNALILGAIGQQAWVPKLTKVADNLIDLVLKGFDTTSAFGYRGIHKTQIVDTPGLLDGAAGIGLGLLTVGGFCDPSWMRNFGIPSWQQSSSSTILG